MLRRDADRGDLRDHRCKGHFRGVSPSNLTGSLYRFGGGIHTAASKHTKCSRDTLVGGLQDCRVQAGHVPAGLIAHSVEVLIAAWCVSWREIETPVPQLRRDREGVNKKKRGVHRSCRSEPDREGAFRTYSGQVQYLVLTADMESYWRASCHCKVRRSTVADALESFESQSKSRGNCGRGDIVHGMVALWLHLKMRRSDRRLFTWGQQQA